MASAALMLSKGATRQKRKVSQTTSIVIVMLRTVIIILSVLLFVVIVISCLSVLDSDRALCDEPRRCRASESTPGQLPLRHL